MSIEIFDDVFDYNYSCIIWGFVKRSAFSIGWLDDEIPEHSSYVCMHSYYNDNDINNLGIIPKLLETPVSKYMDGSNPLNAVVNISSPGQTFFEHTHPSEWDGSVNNKSPKAFIYYPNLEWRREWGGETMYYTMDNKELERAIEYRPNRLVVVDGEYPHAVRPPTAHAPFFRFTLAMFFGKVK